MKLSIAFCGTVALAGRADKRGKSGRQIVNNDRYIWKTPVCLTTPALCDSSCHKTFRRSFGNITITPEEYTAKKSCLWTIDIPADRELNLQFTSFDLEWHHVCAYDKVHIYDGLDNSRIGRFCGPKQNGQHNFKPFDGSRKNRPINGELEFWDKPYSTQSHKIMVAFDSDQSHNDFNGFTLQWKSKKIPKTNFRSVFYSLDYIRRNMLKRLQLKDFPDNSGDSLKKNVIGKISQAKRLITRERDCSRDSSAPVSDTVYNQLVNIHEMNEPGVRTFANYAYLIRDLALDYVSACRGSGHWAQGSERLITKWDNLIRKHGL